MVNKSPLTIEKYFHRGKDPYKEIVWTKSDVEITDDDGKKLFTQKDVEAPEHWSPLARKVAASKYFYGEQGTVERESSVRQLVGRIAETISNWGLNHEYFDESNRDIFHYELAQVLFEQRAAFNSPVWFNVGTDRYISRKTKDKREGYIIKNERAIKIPKREDHLYPQTSACFIQSVGDTMEEIMELATKEALLFRHGSGTGTDLSTLRSSREKLSGGGKPSGPIAYLVFYDKVAAIVKSGGKTRRAAKMDSLKDHHPDIREFILAKQYQEDLVDILMDAGIDWKTARDNVHFQNANLSVRVSDEFMNAVKDNQKWKTMPVNNKEMRDEMPEYDAKELFNLIAKGTWRCGDPGIQFNNTINRWHTCPNSGEINASNPCSEYMFLDNSSCNLASHNLMKYMDEKGNFRFQDFEKAIKIMTIAQDLLYENSSFPTREIAKNSYLHRALGQGYANLGSLLMYLGLPYDSDEARNVASTITSFLTAKIYEASTELAEKIGPFKEFEKNKEPMLNVMKMHQDATKKIDKNRLPRGIGLEEMLEETKRSYKRLIERGRKYGFRNAQASVLAPTGTIGFVMDCDTTGIEPDIALVKYKLLSDGGKLKIVNRNIGPSLKRLGYSEEKIKSILEDILENETIEGSELREEHLPIFDCSFKPDKGKRSIDSMAHINMLAAAQPFISGGISKTINMNKEATEKEIKSAYWKAWGKGLKAVAIYRDKSKRMQPLSASERRELEFKKPVRRKLPGTRKSITHKFNVAGHEGYLNVGLYPEERPGELFINMSKEGSTIGGLMDTIGILTSLTLQHGAPLESLIEKLRHQKFEPRGLVFEGHSEIKTADSIIDYIFHWLGKTFVKNYGKNNNEKKLSEESIETNERKDANQNTLEEIPGEPGGFCLVCGSQMYKFGPCEERCKCGYIDYSGCGK